MMSDRSDITVVDFEGTSPRIDPSVFLAPGVRIVGDVEVGIDASIWFNVVIRGDVGSVVIGARTNIQDGSLCHVTNNEADLHVGSDVTVGHGVVLHGATIQDGSLIGMGATVLDHAIVEPGAIVAAGALLPPRFVAPSGTLVAGVPARVVRDLTEEEVNAGRNGARNYVGYVERFRNSGHGW
jgi:carbonic anhydrase/acetyltransferase-like protein (isoleucine patch superfamily)